MNIIYFCCNLSGGFKNVRWRFRLFKIFIGFFDNLKVVEVNVNYVKICFF